MVDVKLNLPEAVEKLVNPVEKLIETVACGVGKVYEPTHVKRMAKARAQEIRTISAAVRNNADLPMYYANGVVGIDATSTSDLASRAAIRLGAQELRKQQNIESVIHFSKNELEKVEGASSESVDPDWTTRFMNSVEDIGDEEMQKLWGKILAGEIKKPKSFSLRTLECIKNLSQQEAQLFYKFLPYFICVRGDVFLPRDNKLLKEFGISFGEILSLEDCGLLVSSNLILTYRLRDANDTLCISNDIDTIILFSTDGKVDDVEVVFEQYKLTTAGRELYEILHKNNSRAYLLRYAKSFNQVAMAKPLKVSVHAVTEYRKDGSISYVDSDLLADSNKIP